MFKIQAVPENTVGGVVAVGFALWPNWCEPLGDVEYFSGAEGFVGRARHSHSI
jgi:hypothetical protein